MFNREHKYESRNACKYVVEWSLFLSMAQLQCHGFADASGTPNVHCFMKHGEDYRGHRSETKSGRRCQSWSVDSPHKSNYKPSTRQDGLVNFLSSVWKSTNLFHEICHTFRYTV